MNPWNIFGHDWAVEMLRQHVQHDALRHAYLLTGPAGVGRRSLAIRLAQAIQCQTPSAPGVPCRTCRACRQIEAGQQIDLMVTQAEAEGGTLKVEQVREVTKFLSLKPYASPFKVVIFLRFEEANANAQNALLKTLEEAPSYALLLLTADNAEQLLPTIVSRCEVLRLRPMRAAAVAEFLVSKGVQAEKARLLGHLSGGRPGYALRLAADEKALAFRAEKLDDLRELLGSSRRARFAYAEKLAKEKDTFRQALFIWLSFWRDVLLRAAGMVVEPVETVVVEPVETAVVEPVETVVVEPVETSDSPLTNLDRAEDVARLGARLSLAEARRLTEQCEQAIERLEKSVNARLLAEVTLMDWPKER